MIVQLKQIIMFSDLQHSLFNEADDVNKLNLIDVHELQRNCRKTDEVVVELIILKIISMNCRLLCPVSTEC